MMAWVVIMALATVFSVNSYVSFWGSYEHLGGFITVLVVFVTLIILLAQLTPKSVTKILAVMSIVGSLISLYALVQNFGMGLTRPVSTLGNPVFLGSFLIITIFITLYFALMSQRLWLRLVYWGLFSLQFVAVLITQSRGPLIGLSIGLMVFVFGWLWIKYAAHIAQFWKRVGMVIAAGAVLGIGIYLLRVPLGIQRIFNYSFAPDTSGHSRLMIAQSIYEAIWSRPLLGFGPENIYVAYDKYYSITPVSSYGELFADRAHSVILDQLASAGWLGLIVMLVVVAMLVWMAVRWIRRVDNPVQKILGLTLLAAAVAYFIQDLVEFDVIVHYIYLMLLAAVFVSLIASGDLPSQRPLASWIRWLAIGISGVMAGFLIVQVCWSSGQGYLLTYRAEQAAQQDNYSEAYKLYEQSFEIGAPYQHWYLRNRYGSFVDRYLGTLDQQPDLAQQILESGISKYQFFIDQEPNKLQARIIYAILNLQLDYLLGDRQVGDKLFESLAQEYPNHLYIFNRWGRELYRLHEFAKAKDILLNATVNGIIPADISFWLGLTEIALNDDQLAIRWLHRATSSPLSQVTDIKPIEFVAEYLASQDRHDDEAAFWKRLTKLQPDNPKYQLSLAVAYGNAGNIELARSTAELIIRRFPETQDSVQEFMLLLE